MTVWIFMGIPFQLSSTMIIYGPQSDIRVKTFARRNLPESSLLNSKCLNRFPAKCGDLEERLWSFLFAMGFIFQQRASQYIIKIYQTSESKVMAIRICMGIPFLVSSAKIYYGAQLDIRVKTFACWNLLESSLLNSECLNRFSDYAEYRRKGFGRLYLWCASFFNNERLNISLTSIRPPSQKLWSFEFAWAFYFNFRAPWYIIGLNWTSEWKLLPVGICPSLPC